MKTFKKMSLVLLLAGLVVGGGAGFFAGMEYKAYQVRKAFNEVFTGNTTPGDVPKKMPDKIIQKQVGDTIDLATISFKVIRSDEQNSVVTKYSQPPLVSGAERKFITVDLEMTNTTKSQFMFFSDGFVLVDDQGRQYNPYKEGYKIAGAIEQTDLAPGLTEKGSMMFEIPKDLQAYSFSIGKAGTNETYMIKLK